MNMMNFNKRAILATLIAVMLTIMILAAGCQSPAPAVQGNNGTQGALLSSVNGQNAVANGISVSGQGSITVKPDVAYISLGVVTPPDADQLKARKANDDAMAKVLAAIKGFGISEDDITTTNFSISPQYDKD
jgi:uncharacterized protein YggE